MPPISGREARPLQRDVSRQARHVLDIGISFCAFGRGKTTIGQCAAKPNRIASRYCLCRQYERIKNVLLSTECQAHVFVHGCDISLPNRQIYPPPLTIVMMIMIALSSRSAHALSWRVFSCLSICCSQAGVRAGVIPRAKEACLYLAHWVCRKSGSRRWVLTIIRKKEPAKAQSSARKSRHTLVAFTRLSLVVKHPILRWTEFSTKAALHLRGEEWPAG
jgi:hypothetical protein